MGRNEETEGEDLIADFLEEKGFDFERYSVIKALKDDDKFFREADFYLTKYGVCIEFLGKWDNPEDIHRYKQKMAIYHKNRIPCVYLWPNNLGNLDWIIKRRLRAALLKYNKIFTLTIYELENYLGENLISAGILIVLIVYVKETGWKIFWALLLAYFIGDTIRKYIKRLSKIKKSKWVTGKDYKKEN